MTNLQLKHGGIILAAGASSRMGRPKALLPVRNQTPLAVHQARQLAEAGAQDILIVLGSEADTIIPLIETPDIRIAYNPHWETGRMSSLQTGLRSLGPVHGALIIPVDTAGVKASTLSHVLEFADTSSALAVRPAWQGTPGRLLWIAGALFDELLGLKSTPHFRLDAWIQDRQVILPVDDSAILNNINRPADWSAIASSL